jgi:Fe-S cluster assembly protein SufD
MIAWRQLARECLETLSPLKTAWAFAASPSLAQFEPPESTHESTLVFVDGFYMPELSRPPSEAICLELDLALKSYGLFLQNQWAKIFKEEKDPLYLLNAAEHGQGLFLYIPPNVQTSLQILHLTAAAEVLASPKIQITLGKNASLSLVQTVKSGSCNGVIDASLDGGAVLKFYSMELLAADAHCSMTFRGRLKRDARLELFHATDGAANVRFHASAKLLEENSSSSFRFLGMLNGERQANIHALVDHAAPHCTSRTTVKMVLNGKSKSSFEGKIYVRSIAQKTESYQLNNNLLLSEAASAVSKPNLEIFADDVKASHGATFSQLSEEELFYLRSRGLAKSEAKSLLMQAFCREMIDSLEIESLKAPLLEAMARTYA